MAFSVYLYVCLCVRVHQRLTDSSEVIPISACQLLHVCASVSNKVKLG